MSYQKAVQCFRDAEARIKATDPDKVQKASLFRGLAHLTEALSKDLEGVEQDLSKLHSDLYQTRQMVQALRR